MYNMCAMMKWSHLPEAGGIYDQDPELLRRWRIIWDKVSQKESDDQKRRDREQKNSARSAGRSSGRRGR